MYYDYISITYEEDKMTYKKGPLIITQATFV